MVRRAFLAHCIPFPCLHSITIDATSFLLVGEASISDYVEVGVTFFLGDLWVASAQITAASRRSRQHVETSPVHTQARNSTT